MRRGLATLVILAACAAVALGFALSSSDGKPGASLSTAATVDAERAPTLSGIDVLTSQELALADFTGRPVVINVWASWCPGCREEAADLWAFASAHPEIQMLGVDIRDDTGSARRFHEEFGWFWPSLFDPDARESGKLATRGLPETFFLNADHEIVARLTGAGDLERFEAGLRAINPG